MEDFRIRVPVLPHVPVAGQESVEFERVRITSFSWLYHLSTVVSPASGSWTRPWLPIVSEPTLMSNSEPISAQMGAGRLSPLLK